MALLSTFLFCFWLQLLCTKETDSHFVHDFMSKVRFFFLSGAPHLPFSIFFIQSRQKLSLDRLSPGQNVRRILWRIHCYGGLVGLNNNLVGWRKENLTGEIWLLIEDNINLVVVLIVVELLYLLMGMALWLPLINVVSNLKENFILQPN